MNRRIQASHDIEFTWLEGGVWQSKIIPKGNAGTVLRTSSMMVSVDFDGYGLVGVDATDLCDPTT